MKVSRGKGHDVRQRLQISGVCANRLPYRRELQQDSAHLLKCHSWRQPDITDGLVATMKVGEEPYIVQTRNG